jgi:hypothetical protein
MGDTTVERIVKETVEVLWEELHPLHMPIPTTEYLKNRVNECEKVWNFPHVVGFLDGKHIRIVSPADTGAMFFNYRKYFSVLLQGLVDANYKFIAVDTGGFGKQSDGGTFLASDLFSFIDGKKISFPEPDFLPHSNVTATYVMLGDEAYPLLPYLMQPYERNSLTERRRSFNERLSRARKTVECAFGILYSKWHIISKAIEAEVELADKIVKCICVLHNTTVEKEGFERHLTDVTVQSKSVAWERRRRLPTEAKNITDLFCLHMEKQTLRYKKIQKSVSVVTS